jgi:outer membrane protein assembly factor BamB
VDCGTRGSPQGSNAEQAGEFHEVRTEDAGACRHDPLCAVFSEAAFAASIIGLVDGKTLVWVDPATKKVTGSADIKGATNVVGIDVRPADGALYAVTSDGSIYTVDAKSGQATMKSKISEQVKGAVTVVDFNPVADRLRVITSEGANLRINVDDGKTTVDGNLKFKDGDASAGKTPNVVAGAYSNSANPKPTATALYDIDASGVLLTQAPPNDGVLNTIRLARLCSSTARLRSTSWSRARTMRPGW